MKGFDQLTKLVCDYYPVDTKYGNPCPERIANNCTLYKTYGNRSWDSDTDFKVMSKIKSISFSTPAIAARRYPLSWIPNYTEFHRKLVYSLARLGLAFVTNNNNLQNFNALLEDDTKPVIILNTITYKM